MKVILNFHNQDKVLSKFGDQELILNEGAFSDFFKTKYLESP